MGLSLGCRGQGATTTLLARGELWATKNEVALPHCSTTNGKRNHISDRFQNRRTGYNGLK